MLAKHKVLIKEGGVMKRPVVFVMLVVVAGTVAAGTAFAEPVNSINFGLGGVVQTMPHCKANIYLVEYEHMLDSKLAVLGRGSDIDYKFDDGRYLEKGRPRGLDIGVRYYPAGGMKGIFFGGTVGYWKTDWTFTNDKGMVSESQGKGDSKAIRANVDIGARFPIGSSPVSIMPALQVGRFFSSTTCEYTAPASRAGTSCSQDGEVSAFYGFLAVSIGIGF